MEHKFAISENPGFIVESLPEYVEQNRDLLVRDVVFGASTVSRINIQTGIKTTAALNSLTADPVLQNGAGCKFTPENSLELTQRTIETALIKVNEEICPDTLLGKWAEYLVRIPEPQRESLPFEAFILSALREAIREKIDTLIWQGDKASNNTDLKWIDGFVKIANADTSTVKVAIAAGTSAYDAIKAVIAKVPAQALRTRRVKAFVAPELFQSFLLELVEKNFYHYAGAENGAAPESVYFPGTAVEVISTNGLAGTGYIFASPSSNLYYGTDIESGAEQFKFVYDEIEETFLVKVRWNSGVQYAFSDLVVLGTIASA